MKCSRPFVQGSAEFGCGQCMPCKLNRRRLWTSRLMLEAQKHEFSRFVTLTYAPKFLPEGGNLVPKHLQDYLKRLRLAVSPVKIRFYGVGEYGDISLRPHYHLALFGTSDDAAIRASWSAGHVHIGTLTAESAGYIVSYVVKGMTKQEDSRLKGLHPEFARMSLKPGIGALTVPDFARSLLDADTGEYVGFVDGDVPGSYKWQGRDFPFGRYLRRKIREELRLPPEEPKVSGELRSFRRAVDLRKHGLSGWKVRELRREKAAQKAAKRFEMSNSRKGIGL